MDTQNRFKVIVHYPAPENKEEFDRRVAKAIAKVLIETLPSKTIDELIATYKESVRVKKKSDN